MGFIIQDDDARTLPCQTFTDGRTHMLQDGMVVLNANTALGDTLAGIDDTRRSDLGPAAAPQQPSPDFRVTVDLITTDMSARDGKTAQFINMARILRRWLPCRRASHPRGDASERASGLQHQRGPVEIAGVALPRTLHVDEPSSHVDWASGNVRLLTEARPWAPEKGRLRRAGVSSFGVSGTNAHVILEEAPQPEALEPAGPGTPGLPSVWVLSGKSQAALHAQATALHTHVTAHPDLDPADIGHTLASGRAVFEHRATVIATDRDQALDALTALTTGQPHPSLVVAPAGGPGGKTAFQIGRAHV